VGRARGRFLRNPALLLGALLCGGLLVIGAFPAAFAPYDPSYQTPALQMINGQPMVAPFPPETRFILGTDLGRHDLLSRVVYGAGGTLAIATVVVVIRLVIGCSLGWQIAWSRGGCGQVTALLTAVSATIPSLLFAWVLIVAIGPDTGFLAFGLGLGLTGWAPWSQLIGDEVRRIRRQPYMEAADVVGVPVGRQLRQHILPNLWPVVIPTLGHEFAAALLILAELGFLGVFNGHGAVVSLDRLSQSTLDIPYHDWGGMLAGTRLEVFRDWWLPVVPASAFFVAIAGFSLLGEGLRAVLDPFDR
jgi:peptide/nickel transport system permease protein